jgi:hypothetical protein
MDSWHFSPGSIADYNRLPTSPTQVELKLRSTPAVEHDDSYVMKQVGCSLKYRRTGMSLQILAIVLSLTNGVMNILPSARERRPSQVSRPKGSYRRRSWRSCEGLGSEIGCIFMSGCY